MLRSLTRLLRQHMMSLATHPHCDNRNRENSLTDVAQRGSVIANELVCAVCVQRERGSSDAESAVRHQAMQQYPALRNRQIRESAEPFFWRTTLPECLRRMAFPKERKKEKQHRNILTTRLLTHTLSVRLLALLMTASPLYSK